jgi:hypothetical protein
MKKCISILLILILVINIESNYLVYSILRFKIQSETWENIKKGISDKDLCLIVVPVNSKSGIYWFEKDKEFLYQWKMYDVVKIKSDKNSTTYYCINDEKEQQLIDNYEKNKNRNNEHEKLLKKILISEYIPTKTFSFHQFLLKQQINSLFILHYKYLFINILSPPPKPCLY